MSLFLVKRPLVFLVRLARLANLAVSGFLGSRAAPLRSLWSPWSSRFPEIRHDPLWSPMVPLWIPAVPCTLPNLACVPFAFCGDALMWHFSIKQLKMKNACL